MEKLSDYTLVIPTLNRARLFKRLILFLIAKKTTFNVVVVDSSEKGIMNENRKVCETSGLKIKHFDYPCDIEPVPKVLDGLKHVTTKFVSLCADDDLVFLDSISKCVNFLESNTDYVACHGYYINYGKDENEDYSIGLEYGGPSLDGERFEERLFQLMTNYQAISYAIFKRDIMMNYFEASLNIEPYSYIELLTGILPLVSGKVKRLPVCYHARARQTAVSTHDNPRWHPLLWFTNDPDGFSKAFIEYRGILKKSILNISSNEIQNIDKLLSLLHAIFLIKAFDPYYIQKIVQEDFKINKLTIQKNKALFLTLLRNELYSTYRKHFSGERLVKLKPNKGASIIFKMPKNVAKSVIDKFALIDLERYLSGINED